MMYFTFATINLISAPILLLIIMRLLGKKITRGELMLATVILAILGPIGTSVCLFLVWAIIAIYAILGISYLYERLQKSEFWNKHI